MGYAIKFYVLTMPFPFLLSPGYYNRAVPRMITPEYMIAQDFKNSQLLFDFISSESNRALKNGNVQSDQKDMITKTSIAHIRAGQNYVAKPYSGRVLFFSHIDSMSHFEALQHPGWSELIQGDMDICKISGDHLSMVELPHVKQITKKFLRCLTELQSEIKMPEWLSPSATPRTGWAKLTDTTPMIRGRSFEGSKSPRQQSLNITAKRVSVSSSSSSLPFGDFGSPAFRIQRKINPQISEPSNSAVDPPLEEKRNFLINLDKCF